MRLPRRRFLALLGASGATAGTGGCDWFRPDRRVELALRGPGLESEKPAVCGLCPAGCGLAVRLVDGLPVGIRGNPRHPLNRGGLCPVGLAGLEVLYSPERVRGPLQRRDGGEHKPVPWEQALDDVAGRLADLRTRNAADRVAILAGAPGRLTRELVEQIARAVGTPHVAFLADEPVLPYTLTQGLDRVPGVDLAGADLVLAFGLDLYEDGPAPVHAMSALLGARDTETRARLMHVGSRLSPSATRASLHLPIRPGTHGALALGVAHVLVREGRFDRRFVEERTAGFEDWTDERGRRRAGFRRMLLERYYPDRVARMCGCDPARIIRIARAFAAARTPVALAGGEATAGSNATWTVMAVQALNALAGAFDRPGGIVPPPRIPLSPLPAVRTAATAGRPSIFARSDGGGILGEDAVAALADRVLDGSREIDLLFVVHADPVHASPAGERFREAMARIPMTVALSSFRDETAAAASYILPAHVPLESWQDATSPPTVAFNVLGLAPPVVEPLFDTRHPGDVLLELARRGGATPETLPWESLVAYLKDRLVGLQKSGQGTVISGSFEETWVRYLEERGWRFLEHGDFDRFWDDLVQAGGWWDPAVPRGDWARLFRTPSGRFEFFSRTLDEAVHRVGGGEDADAFRRGAQALGLRADADEAGLPHHEPPVEVGDGSLLLVPFTPVTARGGAAGFSPMVLEMVGIHVFTGWDTWAELGRKDAHHLGLEDGDRVALESERGAVEAVLRVTAATPPGVVHVACGFDRPSSRWGSIGSNPNRILAPVRDPLSGSLSTTSTRVRLRLVRRRERGGPVPRHAHGEEV